MSYELVSIYAIISNITIDQLLRKHQRWHMRHKVIINEFYRQEEQLLMDNEIAVNKQATLILLIIGAGFIPFVFLLRFLGFFIFDIEDGLVPLITTAIVFIIPSIFGAFNCYLNHWFKYIIVVAVTLGIPSVYIEFDYMMLMLWIMPILTSCLYFNKRLNTISLLFTILVLGFTSYYRSYQRLIDGLISERIGGFFKDFLVSFTTYTLLTCVMFIFIHAITKKTNDLIYDMIKSKQYEKMSITDGLTGVFNYRYLMGVLERNKLEFDRDGTPFTIAVFDLDHFKQINETYGHLVGDNALIQICSCLQKNIRKNDIVGRYGGEEFVVIFPNTTMNDAYLIAERCREAISTTTIQNLTFHLTVSGGIQEYTGGLISDMLNIADKKLYSAKDAGRNKVETKFTQD